MTDTNKTSGAEVLHAIDQADTALSVAGLRRDDIFRRELRQTRTAVAALIERNAELEAERDEALRRANRADARVKGWESTMVVRGLPRRICPVEGWGPGEGETVEIPALTPEKLTEILDQVDALAAEVKSLREERDAAMGNIHAEIAANLAFREAGGALPDEDMPTFCARLIAERKALGKDAERFTWQVAEWCRPQVTANMAIIEAYRTGDIDIIRAAIDAARASAATGGGNG